jgi:hypothetical protein
MFDTRLSLCGDSKGEPKVMCGAVLFWATLRQPNPFARVLVVYLMGTQIAADLTHPPTSVLRRWH